MLGPRCLTLDLLASAEDSSAFEATLAVVHYAARLTEALRVADELTLDELTLVAIEQHGTYIPISLYICIIYTYFLVL